MRKKQVTKKALIFNGEEIPKGSSVAPKRDGSGDFTLIEVPMFVSDEFKAKILDGNIHVSKSAVEEVKKIL